MVFFPQTTAFPAVPGAASALWKSAVCGLISAFLSSCSNGGICASLVTAPPMRLYPGSTPSVKEGRRWTGQRSGNARHDVFHAGNGDAVAQGLIPGGVRCAGDVRPAVRKALEPLAFQRRQAPDEPGRRFFFLCLLNDQVGGVLLLAGALDEFDDEAGVALIDGLLEYGFDARVRREIRLIREQIRIFDYNRASEMTEELIRELSQG